jgi:hypothetical protein
MFEHALNQLKGWFEPAALDFSAKKSANVTFDLNGGRCVHLNAAGEFETGVGETDMAIFLLQASNDYDVDNPGTTPSGNFMHQQVAPAGNMSGLVAEGAYELESTEFATAQEYVPNDLLTATVANTTAATGGLLTNAGSGAGGDVEQFVDPVCGVVSRGRYKNEHGIEVVAFWPTYIPGAYTS